ncbi:hypothetical protein Psi01_25860 [Planobispora siamensis]|uniref:Uncharacterized protein n=1 Tax=Planobispora siamensis TaxID=936338 RepID=A0A8J3SG44_9ACTN|nr:hypothetical protein Psi01_25860 [Planobispora siamensis]
MATKLPIQFFGLGTPRTGLWCERCALPSAVEVDVYFIVGSGEPMVAGTHSTCPGCSHAEE